jgi:hypothetical protein
MLDVVLTYSTDEGTQEVVINDGRASFGRGDVDNRIDDDGLSRLHATVYREGDNVWVVDENSTNGTFVNGAQVQGAGTPLRDGDIVRIGNHTNMRVSITQKAVAATPIARSTVMAASAAPAVPASSSSLPILPIVIIAGAAFIILLTTVVIGFTVFGGGNKPQIVQRETNPEDDPPVKDPKDSPTPKSSSSPGTTATPGNSTITPSITGVTTTTTPDITSVKKYLDMSDAERRKYLEVKAMKVAQVIGNNSSEQIPAAAIDKIKGFTDAYASRVKAKVRTGSCGFGDNLQATYERAAKDAPFINHAFNEKGMDPRIGLYQAMIESEHCVCLQSPTGPLGMFQFTKATAALHGLKVFAGASPSNPDERCEPEPAARAAASYMKALAGRYGTGPSSVPLAIGSYNSGEGGLSQNLEKALSSGQGIERDFWSLISKSEILSKQFQAENFKYVPKFFAAAIIGENPQDFGLNLQPVSTYSK